MSLVVIKDSILPSFIFRHEYTYPKDDTFRKSHYLIFRMNKNQ